MKKKVRALLLSAGYGTRLRPITKSIPKCLVDLGGEPLLGIWLQKISKINNIDSVFINKHYLSKKVDFYLSKNKNFPFSIKSSYEKNLMGTAGTLLKNLKFFKGHIGIMIHADNYSLFDLNILINAHKNRNKNTILTMLTFNTLNPCSCGIVEKDKSNVLVSFHEKVYNPPTNCANAAIYVFEDEFLEWLKFNKPNASDFSNEVLPYLNGLAQTCHTELPYYDIGTIDSLNEARKYLENNNDK